MANVALADSFLESLASLDAADVKRAVNFVDKLVRVPEAASLRPRIVHDAADRSVRSFKVTHDLRAIAHVTGDEIVLLHVARHDPAYAWARDRCLSCHAETRELWLTSIGKGDRPRALVVHACSSSDELCRLLRNHGIDQYPGGDGI